MITVIDFVENNHLLGRYPEHDEPLLQRNVNLEQYSSLREMCEDLVHIIADDQLYLDAEWNLMHYYHDEKGFTKEDYEYLESCGYEVDQFDYDIRNECGEGCEARDCGECEYGNALREIWDEDMKNSKPPIRKEGN